MRATILSIGSELLQGFLTDTNATHLAQELNALGVDVVGVFQVDDDLDRIVRAFQRAVDDSEIVVASGGIGPTDDDLTREAVATIVGETPVVDEGIANTIREFFTRRGIVMPEQNVKQAWVIPSCEVLSNPIGTAPGWFVSHRDRSIVIMPGVPREMYRMWREQAVPRVLRRLGADTIVAETLKTIGIGESAVEQEIKHIIARGHPVVATYAKDDGVHIRITAHATSRGQAEALVAATVGDIRESVGRFVYGTLDLPLATAVLEPVASRGSRIAIWEAGNAGRLASMLAESELAEHVLDSCVTVTARSLEFDDDHSPSTLAASGARQARATSGTDYGAAVVVRIADGDSPDRKAGDIAIALSGPRGDSLRTQSVMSNPPEIRRRATMTAAEFLWTSLRDETADHLD